MPAIPRLFPSCWDQVCKNIVKNKSNDQASKHIWKESKNALIVFLNLIFAFSAHARIRLITFTRIVAITANLKVNRYAFPVSASENMCR